MKTFHVVVFLSILYFVNGAPLKQNRNSNKKEINNIKSIVQVITKEDTSHKAKFPGRTKEQKPSNDENEAPKVVPLNLIDAPKFCPEGQGFDQSGNCRSNFGRKRRAAAKAAKKVETTQPPAAAPACIIGCDLPTINPCPPNQKPDNSGTCRDIWDG